MIRSISALASVARSFAACSGFPFSAFSALVAARNAISSRCNWGSMALGSRAATSDQILAATGRPPSRRATSWPRALSSLRRSWGEKPAVFRDNSSSSFTRLAPPRGDEHPCPLQPQIDRVAQHLLGLIQQGNRGLELALLPQQFHGGQPGPDIAGELLPCRVQQGLASATCPGPPPSRP